MAAAQHWRWWQCNDGSVSSAPRRQAAAWRRCSPSSSLMMSILCGAGVVGGGYYNVFDLSSYELLSGWRQCGGSALAAAQRRQRGNDSVAVVAVRWQHGGGQRGGGAGSAAALAARRRRPAWWLQRKFGRITASAVAAERRELRCRRALPRWRQRHRRQQRWRGHYQQSTIN